MASPNQRLSGHYASVYPSQHDANLVLSALRHQRDLFSGGPSLGIPDVNTHVGSVIHAFENLAYQRNIKEGEKPYESSKSTSSAGKKDSIYKIILPPPPKASTGTLTDPPKHIVRHRPKGKAPDLPTTSSTTNTASATTQTTKFSGDENESSALDSLNLEDDYHRNKSNHNKFPQSYVKNYKVLPPFAPPPPRHPSRIPTKSTNKATNQPSARNRMSDSLLMSKARTDVFLKPTKYTEDDIENDFLRGSTVSQSFIKNVVRKAPPPSRMISTYEQNFLINNDDNSGGKVRRKSLERGQRDQKSRSASSKLEQPLIDEVSARYKEYSSNNDVTSLRNNNNISSSGSKQTNFHPRSIDRAEL